MRNICDKSGTKVRSKQGPSPLGMGCNISCHSLLPPEGQLKARTSSFFLSLLFISYQQFAALPVNSQETVALSLHDWQFG